MEVFDSTIFANDDDDPKNFINNYASLSQFDLDLQQQAQAAMQQGTWQDFDMFLPQLDCPNLFYNAPITPPHAFPTPSPPQRPVEQTTTTTTTTNNNNMPLFDTAFMDDTTTLYSQASSLLPPNNMIPAVSEGENNGSNSMIKQQQMPISPPLVSFDTTPVVPSQWSDPEPKPEPIGSSSPILSENVAMSTSCSLDNEQRHITPPPDMSGPPPLPLPQSTSSTSIPTTQQQQQQWNTTETSAKVPIQRLKPPVTGITTTPTSPSGASSTAPTGRTQKKTAHNAIERRYRNNINDRITELKNAVPALVHAKLKDSRTTGGAGASNKRSHRSVEDDDEEAEDGEEYMDGVAVATKLNKATILRKATEYITHLKKTGEDMRRENALLQQLLAQLPGGHEVLGRYQMQKVQREQEMQRQRMEEKQMMMKQQQQQRKSRKRTRTQEEYPSSSSSPASSAHSDPLTPPAGANVGNRVFMAIFACLTFFSSSPLTTGPSSAEQFQNHQHAARTTSADSATVNTTTHSKSMTLDSFLPFEDGWSTLRTAVFVLFLAHLLLPLIGTWLWPFSLNVRRVSRSKRLASHKRTSTLKSSHIASTPAFTPGDQKCFRIYDIIVKMLESNEDGPPRTTTGYVTQTLKEASRFIARHTFGYEILYNEEEERLIPEDEWEQACRWIKLNEIECLGGNPEATRWTMLHSCLRMLNLVEVMEDEEHPELSQMRARVYATAAMQFSVANLPLIPTKRLVRYLLGMAVYEPFSDNTDGDVHMRSLVSQQEQQHDLVDSILNSQAWSEALDVMRHQMGQFSTMSLSLAAPVVVPVAVLSTLQHLNHLQKQFDHLIVGMASNNNEKDEKTLAAQHETSFFDPSPLADSEQQQLAFWLAAVGMTVESLWRNDDDMTAIEQWMEIVVKRVPRSLTSTHGGFQDNVAALKKRNNMLDEMIKKSIVLVLVGAVLIKRGGTDHVEQGIEQLERAERLRGSIKKLLQNKKDVSPAAVVSLETVVLAQAEFAVAMVGLEAWITAWKHKGGEMRARVRQAELDLRRMIRRPPLLDDALTANQIIVARLVRLGQFVSRQPDDVDSASDASDIEDDANTGSLSYNMTATSDEDDSSIVKQADRALDILHGIIA